MHHSKSWVILLATFLSLATSAEGEARRILIAGQLKRGGTWFSGQVDLAVRLYESGLGGQAVWQRHCPSTDVMQGGLFAFALVGGVPDFSSVPLQRNLWVQLTADGQAFSPRLRLWELHHVLDDSETSTGEYTAILVGSFGPLAAEFLPDRVESILARIAPEEKQKEVLAALRKAVEREVHPSWPTLDVLVNTGHWELLAFVASAGPAFNRTQVLKVLEQAGGAKALPYLVRALEDPKMAMSPIGGEENVAKFRHLEYLSEALPRATGLSFADVDFHSYEGRLAAAEKTRKLLSARQPERQRAGGTGQCGDAVLPEAAAMPETSQHLASPRRAWGTNVVLALAVIAVGGGGAGAWLLLRRRSRG